MKPALIRTLFGLTGTALLVAAGAWAQSQPAARAPNSLIKGSASAAPKAGYPSLAATKKAYDESDLDRAIQAYRFFYPSVSAAAIFKGNRALGLVDNKVFGVQETKPHHVGFTLNSDTPYGPILLDLKQGPMVLEVPAAPLIVIAMDANQRWVADMGIPGPEQGKGAKHLILPPDYEKAVPSGYHVWRSGTNHVIVGVRSLPLQGDVQGALARIKTVRVHPLQPPADWSQPEWIDLSDKPQDTTPLAWERNLEFWRVLHELIQQETPSAGDPNYFGELAALGIAKGKPFAPDPRMKGILERAAKEANDRMRVQAFADRRPDRVVWPDRQWEWIGLVPSNGDFATYAYTDLEARETWFYQAIGASPAMFRRTSGAGSLYWLAARDAQSAYLDGGKTYKLVVPIPVPGKLFWSVTAYDAETRSQVNTDQGRAALRSMFELQHLGANSGELYFGPTLPKGVPSERWIKTVPGRGWFAYFRVYGPEPSAFDGTWKPGDLEPVK
ncbi:MAG: DUF1254 domain-containing protein [Myxococcales bacterium]